MEIALMIMPMMEWGWELCDEELGAPYGPWRKDFLKGVLGWMFQEGGPEDKELGVVPGHTK